MQSTLTARQTDPHDVFVFEPDVELAARADASDPQRREPNLRALVSEISAGVAEQAAAPNVDTSFRAAHVQRKRGRWVTRFVAVFLFALVSAVGAGAWQRYGDRAQAVIAMAAPLLGLSSLQATSAPSAPAVAEATQASAPAETATAPPAEAAAASAPTSPDQTQLIQSMSHDLAALGQQVEALKANIAQLKAGQEQLARDAKAAEIKAAEIKAAEAKASEAKAAETKASEAKAFEQTMRAKVSALPPHPPAAPVRKPKPNVPPVQATAAPLLPPPGAPGSTPVQIAPAPPPPVSAAPQDDVPRPPMPVR
jgi:cytoskeletal protein RodZ